MSGPFDPHADATPPGDPGLRAYLAALPEPRLPDLLWSRLAAAQRRRHRRRQLVRYSLAAAALLAVAVIPPWPGLWSPTSAPAPVESPFAAAEARHALESEIRALDRALQAAYERGASEQEAATLWQARDRAVARLRSGADPLPQPVRI